MLGAFWQDVEFQDGARARSLADLPDSIKVHLHELSTQAKRYGGLHAAMGTLGAGASGSVRLALLRIIYKSVGLPENYANASFVMWLRAENILDQVKEKVEAKGYDWNEELDNLYVAEGLHESLSEVKPNLFPMPESCIETLNNRFPNKSDVTSDEMIKSIKDGQACCVWQVCPVEREHLVCDALEIGGHRRHVLAAGVVIVGPEVHPAAGQTVERLGRWYHIGPVGPDGMGRPQVGVCGVGVLLALTDHDRPVAEVHVPRCPEW